MRIMYRILFQKIVMLTIILSVSACSAGFQAGPKDGKTRFAQIPGHMKRVKELAHPHYKVGKAYKIKGKWYQPYEDFDHDEVGVASWYGPDCHGKKTATGTRFNMHDLTAAHRTLPLPCMVKVTNLENQKSVVLRVIDRGPYAFNRVIDISKEGAKRLGFIGKGSAKVRVTLLKEPSLRMAGIVPRDGQHKPMPKITDYHPDLDMKLVESAFDKKGAKKIQLAELKKHQGKKGEKNKALYIQTGSFTNYNGACTLSKKLSKYAPAYVASTEVKGKNRYRVHLGPLKSSAEAKKIVALMSKNGHRDAKIMQVS